MKIFHCKFYIQRVSNGYGTKGKEKKLGKVEKEVKVGRVSKEDRMEVKNKLLIENRASIGNAKISFDGKKTYTVSRVCLKSNTMLNY